MSKPSHQTLPPNTTAPEDVQQPDPPPLALSVSQPRGSGPSRKSPSLRVRPESELKESFPIDFKHLKTYLTDRFVAQKSHRS